MAGQHRNEGLKILHSEWDKQIKQLEGLVDSAKAEGNANVSSLESEAEAIQKKKAMNGRWVIVVWDKGELHVIVARKQLLPIIADSVDDELGLELASNEVQHAYKPSELKMSMANCSMLFMQLVPKAPRKQMQCC